MEEDMQLFEKKALLIMDRAIPIWGLKPFQAAALPGNFGRETGGFAAFQEIAPRAGRGGLGWAQWTGPRRVKFERFCADHKLSPFSDEGNWAYLRYEIDKDFPNLMGKMRNCLCLRDAVSVFEAIYEGAGVVALEDRVYWATRAMRAWDTRQAAQQKPIS
jgi:Phage tail lysozyme